MDSYHPTPADVEAAQHRRSAFLAAIPEETRAAEDRIPAVVRTMNASTRSKLHRIYHVADMLSNTRAPFVACGKGCASCCHMNVQISQHEAQRLGKAIGRKHANLKQSISSPPDKYAGVPCPFLDVSKACSVYADRPLMCRTHASFLENAETCHPSAMNRVTVPKVKYDGLTEALTSVSKELPVFADIREFFPARES